MASPTKSKHGVYYYTVRVPRDLIKSVGRSVLSESLGTKDADTAKQLFAERHSRSLREWSVLRSEVRSLTHKQAVALAGVRYHSFVDHLEDNPGPASELRNLLSMTEGVDRLPERLETWYAKAVDKMLLEEGIRIDHDSRLRLMEQLHGADQQAIVQLERNAQGDYRPDPDAGRFPEWVGATSEAVTLDYLFGLWEREHLANGGVAKTVKDFRQKVDALADYIGHTDAERVSHSQLAGWCDFLRHEQGKAPRTVRDKYLAAVKAIYRLGVNKGKLESNPARDVTMRVPTPIRSRSKGFTDAEALSILQSALADPVALGGVSDGNKLAFRWVPWICAYTGARVREITQLRKQDLVIEAGIPCFRITPDAGSVKTRKYRFVPVHGHLVEMGLLQLFQAASDGPIFFSLNGLHDDPVSRSESVAKKVAQWVRETAKVTDKRVLPNHGWRHRFKTIADDVGIDPKYSDALQGHSDGRASSGYGERTVQALNRELQKMPRYAVKS